VRHAVCLISDRHRLGPDGGDALIRRIAIAARAGVHLVQMRERDMPDGALVELVARAVAAARATATRILVNDRVDVAIAAAAHGVHLRGDSAPASRVRAMAPSGFLIGRSVHSVDEAVRVAGEGGLDYLLFGPVFDTASKPGRAAGVEALRQVVTAVPRLPVLAVGGVTIATAGRLSGTCCAGLAAIGLFAHGPESQLASVVTGALAPWENRG
jgi:thiamine-phosphate pyrophosphorylase